MKLHKNQEEAYKRFLNRENCIIDAPRRSGKTFLLQEILRLNPKINFSILTPNYRMFKLFYEQFPNAHYGLGKTYVLADEVMYNNKFDNYCMSIGTFWETNKDTWEFPKHLEEHKEDFKKNLGPKIYHNEFGKYENIKKTSEKNTGSISE